MALDEDRLYRLIGERIRAARERVAPKLSQARLAEKLGVSRASIVNIEAGRQRAPVHVLWQIAEILSVEIGFLIPTHAEYVEEGAPVRLDAEIVEQIEEAANGDPATRRLLTAFISKARTHTPEGS